MPASKQGIWYSGRSNVLGRLLCWMRLHKKQYHGDWDNRDGGVVCDRCGKDF